MNLRRAGLSLVALLLATVSVAQTEPVVRVEVTPGTVTVGESVELAVTVLVPTWFPRPPVYPSFELANAITRLPADSSNPVRERVGRDSWSGIQRRYRIYPLLGATYRLSGQTMRVTYANPGASPLTAEVELPEVVFRGSVPAGAEALDPYIAGRSLALELSVEGKTDALKAGDALVLEYQAELDGLPAIFIPPLAPDLTFEGVAVYADQPMVEEGAPARRSERITLVFEAGGEFTIPDVRLQFWNTDSRNTETVTARGFSVSIAGPPPDSIERFETSQRVRWPLGVAVLVALLTAAYLLWRIVPQLAQRYRAEEQRRRQTEAYAFEALRKSLSARDARGVYGHLLTWASRLSPAIDARLLVRDYGDESLRQNMDALSAFLYAASDAAPDFTELGRGLAAARARYLADSRAAAGAALPPLNP
jgi:hypothetical protein